MAVNYANLGGSAVGKAADAAVPGQLGRAAVGKVSALYPAAETTTPTDPVAPAAPDMELVNALGEALDAWGLGSLAPWLLSQAQAGSDQLTILNELRQRPEYKARFPAMDALQKAGRDNNMPVVTEGQYLQMEQAYRSALYGSGLPPEMFDSADDFIQLLTNNIDPTEVQDRIAAAKIAVDQTDPYVRGQLRSIYGITEQDLLAYALAPDRNAQYIQKVATSAMIAGLSQRQGLAAAAGSWERYAQDAMNQQMDQSQIVESVANAAALSQVQTRLAGIEGGTFTGEEALDVTIRKDAGKVLKSQQRAAREKARFAGSSGLSGTSLTSASNI